MEIEIKSLKQIKLDDFVKFVDKDKKGKIEYIGKVVSINEATNTVELLCVDGDFGFVVGKNSLFQTNETPVNWERFLKDPSKFRQTQKQKEIKKDFSPVVKTLKEKIQDFVNENKIIKEDKLVKLALKQFEGDSTTITNYVKLFKLKVK